MQDVALERYLHWSDLKRRSRVFGPGLPIEDVWAAAQWMRLPEKQALPLPGGRNGSEMVIANRLEPILLICNELEARGVGIHADGLDPDVQDPSYALACTLEELRATVAIEGATTTREEAQELWWTLDHDSRLSPPSEIRLRMLLNAMKAWRELPQWAEKPLTPKLLLRMQRTVTAGTLDDPDDVGRFRTDDEVRVSDSLSAISVHVPPPAKVLGPAMKALCDFANAPDESRPYLHPLVRAILLHFALAYYHPFGDGNGRTARLLFQWSVLRHRDLLWFHGVPVSATILRAKERYDRSFLLTETDGLDTTYFVLDQLTFLKQASKEYRSHLEERCQEREALRKKLRGDGLNARQLDAIFYFSQHPGGELTQAEHARRHGVSHPTASTDLNELVARGLLDRQGSRPIRYLPSPKLLRLLQRGVRPRKGRSGA